MSLVIDTSFNKAPGSAHTTPSATPTCKRPTPLVGRWGDYAWDNFVEGTANPETNPETGDHSTATPHSRPADAADYDQEDVKQVLEAISPQLDEQAKTATSSESADSAPVARKQQPKTSPSTSARQSAQASPNNSSLPRHAHQPYSHSPPASLNSSFNHQGAILPSGLTDSTSLAGSLNTQYQQPQWTATGSDSPAYHSSVPPPPAHVQGGHRSPVPQQQQQQQQQQPQEHHYYPQQYQQQYQQYQQSPQQQQMPASVNPRLARASAQQQPQQQQYSQQGGAFPMPAQQHYMPSNQQRGPAGGYPAPTQYQQPATTYAPNSYPGPMPPALQTGSAYFPGSASKQQSSYGGGQNAAQPAAAHHAPASRPMATSAGTGITAMFANPSGGPMQITRFPPPPPPTARLMQVIEADGVDPEIGRAIALRWYKKAVASQPAHPNVSPCPEPDFNLRPWRDWLNVIGEWWKINYAGMKTSPIFGPPSVSPNGSKEKRSRNTGSNNNRSQQGDSRGNRSQGGNSNPPSANNRTGGGGGSNPPSANNRMPQSQQRTTSPSSSSSPGTTPPTSVNNRMGMGSSQPSSANNRMPRSEQSGGSQPNSANRRTMKRQHADPVDTTV